MNNLIDSYTRLKLRIGTNILVTYYSNYGKKITKKVKLLDIYKFSFIKILDNNKPLILYYFNYDCIIESIKCCDSNFNLYYNPYINSKVFDNKYINEKYFYEIRKKILGHTNIDYDEIDKRIENYLGKYHNFNYNDLFFTEKQKKEFESFFSLLIKDIINNSHLDKHTTKLSYISSGTSSLVYSIGDKIIKIGKPRWKYKIPYCEYLLQPIINQDFIFDGYPIHIEITEKVKTLDENSLDIKQYNDISKNLKKLLLSIGLSASDLHPENIGILLKDNKIHYNSINFDVGNDNATSIINNNNLKILKTGNFVIIDLDLIEIKDIKKYTNYLNQIGYNINIETISKQKKYILSK